MEALSEKVVRIHGLPAEATEDGLKEYFSKYGEVDRAVIQRDEASGEPKDYGNVWFVREECARAVADDSDHFILGTKVELTIREPSPPVGPAVPGENSKKIFVGGLPIGLTTKQFKDYFGKFGTITDAVIITDRETRRPRGFGFVTFDSEDAARVVLQNPRHFINDKDVEVKPAIPKEEAAVTEQSHGNFLDVYDPAAVYLHGYSHFFPQQFPWFYCHNGWLARGHQPGVVPMMPLWIYPSMSSNYNSANWPRYKGIPQFYGGPNAFAPAAPTQFQGFLGYNGLPAKENRPAIRISAPQRLNGGDGASSSSPQVDDQPSSSGIAGCDDKDVDEAR